MRSLLFAVSFLTVASAGGCSDGNAGSEASDSASAAVTGGIQLDTGSTGSDGPTVGVSDGPGSACGSLEVSDGCTGEVFEGEGIPLDIQIIFDQSGSMASVIDAATGETRMDAVVRAVEAFVADS